MDPVVSFRPSKEEAALIERTRRRLGLRSRAQAVRHLVRQGALAAGPLREDPVFKFRLPTKARGRAVTSRGIDRELYGED